MLLLLGDGIKRSSGALAGAQASDKAVGETQGRAGALSGCAGRPEAAHSELEEQGSATAGSC